ncbi:unnamed protein product [Pelagomonas calceolata]|uniref:Uncharacterized protein n=1 Tax=Pelagomonas calceolata TaxID=35677 RepID=A0A8J2S7S2_9STRA|nr:unnamed protein product [Pelagomonas calceolata]
MKVILYLAAGAAAFSFGAKKGAKSAPKPSAGRQVAKGGQTASTIVVPDTLKPFAGFGNPTIVAQRAAEREAKKEETLSKLIPTPGRFLFAFGRPDVLAARRAERCAKWEWSEEFLNKARPDKFGVGNYGAGDLYDDGLTRLERNQMVSGREGFLTGAAKLRYRRITGQIEDADASGLSAEMQNSAGKGNSYIDVEYR